MVKLLGASLLVLWLQADWVSSQQKNDGQQVKQNSPSLTVQEGKISILNCDYNNNLFDYFMWYKKYPDEGPTFLISIRLNVENSKNGRFTVFLNKTAKHLSLYIATSQLEDSATYFCAASTQCYAGTCSLYSNLQLGSTPALTLGFQKRRHQACFHYTWQCERACFKVDETS
ncbi:T-cell receptor alpha chain V region CTL-L17 [Heterocephalus glaber]|nr:T-cell receptor alpha chain V region CTL-L17 [Heterocephalus glaber]